jgi:hypothetical protein
MSLVFGPDELATTWDGLTVSHHCTVSRNEEPLGVLFRMEHPAGPIQFSGPPGELDGNPATEECPAFSSYRFEGIDGSCACALQRNLVLPDP